MKEITKLIIDLTGIHPNMVADAPEFLDVCDEIASYFKGRIPVAYCGNGFDFPFLKKEFEKYGREFEYDHTPFDPKKTVNEKLKQLNNKNLVTVANYLNIPLLSAHRAMSDTEALKYVFYNLCLGISLDTCDEFRAYDKECNKNIKFREINVDTNSIDFDFFEALADKFEIKLTIIDKKKNVKKEIAYGKDFDIDNLKKLIEVRSELGEGDSLGISL